MKNAVSIIFFSILWFSALSVTALHGQVPSIAKLPDSLFLQPVLRFGTEKSANTWFFRGDFDGKFSFGASSLLLHQQYRGRTIRSASPSVRDDDELLAHYDYALSDEFRLHSSSSTIFSSDSRTVGINRLLQTVLSGGFQYKPAPYFSSEISGGFEQNEQVGITDNGWRMGGRTMLTNFTLEEFALNTQASGDYSRLGSERVNSQTNVAVRLSRSLGADEELELNAGYSSLRRDFYTLFSADSLPSLETRAENQIRAGVRFLFPIAIVSTELKASLEHLAVKRQYNAPISGSISSALGRSLDELRIALSAFAKADFSGHSHRIGASYDSRDEANGVSQLFPISENEFFSLRSAEQARDNSSARFSLLEQSSFRLFSADTLSVSSYASILRYDTPSSQNFDDRDELSLSVGVTYFHEFSSRLRATFTLGGQALHLVYLKAQRSAQNNWNRIIRFSPMVEFRLPSFSMRPQFEVLANYTNYDFEDRLGQSQSFSFRQISYRDSLVWNAGNTLRTEARISARYFERGEFHWQSFSEIPRDRNFEQFYTVLFFVQPLPNLHVGMGGRFYVLSQKKLTTQALSVPDMFHRTLGPESIVSAEFPSGTRISMRGWYEFQFDGAVETRRLPNFFLAVEMPVAKR